MIVNKETKILNVLLLLTLLLVLIFPFFTYADTQTVPTATGKDTPARGNIVYVCMTGAPGECTFADLVAAVRQIVKWGTGFAISFSVIVIAYAGGTYMIYADNPSKRSGANEMLRKAAMGIVFILLAWIIVNLVLKGLEVTVPNYLQ